jgi:hypothetical protein
MVKPAICRDRWRREADLHVALKRVPAAYHNDHSNIGTNSMIMMMIIMVASTLSGLKTGLPPI